MTDKEVCLCESHKGGRWNYSFFIEQT